MVHRGSAPDCWTQATPPGLLHGWAGRGPGEPWLKALPFSADNGAADGLQREVKKKLTALTHVQDDMDKYIGLCLILSELISNPRVPMDWISSDPTLAACLRS